MTTRPRSAACLALALAALALAPLAQAASSTRSERRVIRRVFDGRKTTRLPSSWSIAGQEYVTTSEYRDLRNGVMELLKRYPPDKYFFVGLGRDPAPVIAFLQNLGEKNLAVNLPGTSNIGWDGQVGTKDVARHIEAAIPASILKGERRIVILDVTSSGKTPAVFGPYIDSYLRARGNTKKVVRLAFSWNNLEQGGYAPQLSDWISTEKWPDFQNYYSGKYEGSWEPGVGGEGIAEHQRHEMGPGVKPPRATNPNYRRFRRALLARMERDAELDRFLSRFANAVPPLKPPPPPAPWVPNLTYKLAQGNAPAGANALLSVKNPVKAKGKGKGKAKKEADADADGDEEGKPPEAYDYLSQNEYRELRDGALAIMKQAPPSKAYYVGVGRSSAALVAFLENLGTDVATYLPADGLHRLAKGRGKGNEEAPEALDALFDAFLPAKALGGARKIVLFHRSDTGASLPYLAGALDQYLQEKGSPAQIEILALAEDRPEEGRFVNVSRSPELKRLNDRKYHLIAPYEFFRPGKQELEEVLTQAGKPRAHLGVYGAFKLALQRRMEEDAALDRALRALPQ